MILVPGIQEQIQETITTERLGSYHNNDSYTTERNRTIDSPSKCHEYYSSVGLRSGLTYCNATYDNYLCWPPTLAGETAFQNCPTARLSDTTRLAFRRCGLNGLWLGRKKNESSVIGWTNYTPCWPVEVRNLFGKVDEADPQQMFEIAKNTRHMEIVGFSVSLLALLISLFIFIHFRSLRNNRTKIHRNLFLAMVTQVIVRLVLYLDQAFIREISDGDPKTLRGLDSMPYICEACYILLEYGICAMFCWMFIEGMFLHNIVTDSVMTERITYRQYWLAGWGVPVFITFIWAIVTALHYNNNIQQCWYGYNFLPQYWVCQGPSMIIITTNMVFLLNILRVIIIKLNQGSDSELEKAKKAVRAALVLLPLLGITNILSMVEAPIDGSVWKFATWSYTTHFLRSFQGFFIALIYCFLNAEVRQVVVKVYRDWSTMRKDVRRMRMHSARNVARRRRRFRHSQESQKSEHLEWTETPCNPNNSEIEMDMELSANDYSDALDRPPTIRFVNETVIIDNV